MVINLKFKALLFLLSALFIFTGCSSQIESPKDIQLFKKELTKHDSWTASGIWIFKAPGLRPTTLTGKSWFEDNGEDYIYQDTYQGISTYLMVSDGLLSAPIDTKPLKKINTSNIKARSRIKQDLFTYNPLDLAQKDNIKMQLQRDGSYFGRSQIYNSNNNIFKSTLKITFSSQGKISTVTYLREYKNHNTDQVIFNYGAFNQTSIEKIAKTLENMTAINYPE